MDRVGYLEELRLHDVVGGESDGQDSCVSYNKDDKWKNKIYSISNCKTRLGKKKNVYLNTE